MIGRRTVSLELLLSYGILNSVYICRHVYTCVYMCACVYLCLLIVSEQGVCATLRVLLFMEVMQILLYYICGYC